jgi:hypothetical protein
MRQTVLVWCRQLWNFIVVVVHRVEYYPLSLFLFQLLYGRKIHHPPDLCANSSFDAIFENPDGIIYVLKGKKMQMSECWKIIGLDISQQQWFILLLA